MLLQRLALLLLLVIALQGCGPPTLKTHGGYELVYRLEPNQDAVDRGVMADAIRSRLKLAGLRDVVVQATNDGQFRVELPAAAKADADIAERLLKAAGHLELRILAERGHDDALIERALAASESGSEATPAECRWIHFDAEHTPIEDWMAVRDAARGNREILVLISEKDVLGSDLKTIARELDSAARPCIAGSLSGVGAAKMTALSKDNTGRRLGIVFDDVLLSAPVIQSEIGNRLQITGDFSEVEVDLIVSALRAGVLPARLEAPPLSIKEVDPQ